MKTKKTYIIAEAGVNHNGNVDTAFLLIEAAKKCGADCVKFQTFKTEEIVSAHSPKANYQLKVTNPNENQFDMLKKLELNMDDFSRLKNHCEKIGIDFLSTPYSFEDADLLERIGVNGYKVASGQIAEIPFLRYLSEKRKKMIVSTGMATFTEVQKAVETIRNHGNPELIILQCTTEYPSQPQDTNLLAMVQMKHELHVRTGYSCHVPGNLACYGAVALGAEIIEKHFTLDKSSPGPDHSSSLEPPEFVDLVKNIRIMESCLGSGVKIPTESELKNKYGMRRSLVARHFLKAGTVITLKDLAFKRPMNGLSPNELDQVIGKTINKDLQQDQPFTKDLLSEF